MAHHPSFNALVASWCLALAAPFAAAGQPTVEAIQKPTYQFSQDIAQTVQATTTPAKRTAAAEQAAVASSFIGDYRAALPHRILLPFLNCEQLLRTRCHQAAAVPGEFKKLVYDSKFTKLENEMSFVNSKPGAFPGLGKQDFGSSNGLG